MKGASERNLVDAFRRADCYVYKPPDDARNWRPCDIFVWPRKKDIGHGRSLWVEVKDPMGSTLPASEIRPAQRAGVAEAMRLGIPYWLACRWRDHGNEWSALDLARYPQDNLLWARSVRHNVEGIHASSAYGLVLLILSESFPVTNG